MSSSALPYRRSPPSWCKSTSTEVRACRSFAAAPLSCAAAPRCSAFAAPPSQARHLTPLPKPPTIHPKPQQVTEHICKLARKGMTPSQIGVLLRDSHGIPQVRYVTGTKVLRILKGHGLAPEIPEDLYHLIKKAVSMRKHLERNRKDKDSKFRLILIESRIHRLARYYKVCVRFAAAFCCVGVVCCVVLLFMPLPLPPFAACLPAARALVLPSLHSLSAYPRQQSPAAAARRAPHHPPKTRPPFFVTALSRHRRRHAAALSASAEVQEASAHLEVRVVDGLDAGRLKQKAATRQAPRSCQGFRPWGVPGHVPCPPLRGGARGLWLGAASTWLACRSPSPLNDASFDVT